MRHNYQRGVAFTYVNALAWTKRCQRWNTWFIREVVEAEDPA